MQSVGAGLRHGVRTTTTRQSQQIQQRIQAASTSHELWGARRYASRGPLSWIRDSLGMNVRKEHTEEELAAARKEQAEKGQLSVFESLLSSTSEEAEEATMTVSPKKKYTEHKYSTANFKISHRKLNMLGRQIAGKPIDSAILQMMFSEKRASKRIKSMLAVAKDHATKLKGLEEKKLVIAEAWVTKGPKLIKRIEPRGRGRMGIREHPDSRLHVLLKEGKTRAELVAQERARKLNRIISAGIVREDVPIRNPGHNWAW